MARADGAYGLDIRVGDNRTAQRAITWGADWCEPQVVISEAAIEISQCVA